MRVRVPATAANLGPGYDSFGVALGRWDEVTAEPSGSGLRIDVEGVGAESVPRDGRHLVMVAAHRAFDVMDVAPPDLHLRCVNRIPHGGGQGSSAAAIVAGVLLAREFVDDRAAALTDAQVFALATAMEGHPDNVAPAMFGGFTLAWVPAAPGATVPPARAVCLTPHPAVRAMAFTARGSFDTSVARAVLPEMIPHRDAAENSARAALLVHALTSEPDLLWEATEDRLHQPYRRQAMPEAARLMDDLRAAGHAAMLSGAGPSLLVLGARLPDPDDFDAAGFDAVELDIPSSGAVVEVRRRGAAPEVRRVTLRGAEEVGTHA